MILIWTSDGGPLQYVGLAMFLLQLLPYLLPQTQTQTQTQTQQASSSDENQIWWNDLLIIIFFVFLTIIASGWILYYYAFPSLLGQQQQNNDDATVVGEDRPDPTTNNSTTTISSLYASMRNFRTRIQTQLRQRTGRTWTDMEVSFLIGACIGLFVAAILFLDATMLALLFHWMVIGIVLYLHVGTIGGTDIHNINNNEEIKLEKLIETVQSMPIEPFVPIEELEKISTPELKQMLQVRGKIVPPPAVDDDTTKSTLIDTLTRHRNYCDTCCICLCNYQRDDPLRILPKCCHEIHLECMDQWVYTFASPTKLQQSPSCPLCKVPL